MRLVLLGKKREYYVKFLIFTHLFGASIGFIKTLKAFIKTFEVPQRSVKIKI